MADVTQLKGALPSFYFSSRHVVVLLVQLKVSASVFLIHRDLSNNQISEIAPDAFHGLRALNSL